MFLIFHSQKFIFKFQVLNIIFFFSMPNWRELRNIQPVKSYPFTTLHFASVFATILHKWIFCNVVDDHKMRFRWKRTFWHTRSFVNTCVANLCADNFHFFCKWIFIIVESKNRNCLESRTSLYKIFVKYTIKFFILFYPCTLYWL